MVDSSSFFVSFADTLNKSFVLKSALSPIDLNTWLTAYLLNLIMYI